MRNDSLKQSIKVVLSLCLVCSFLVSGAVVLLNARQQENQRLNKINNILIAADLYQTDGNSDEIYKQRIEPVLIDLASGDPVAVQRISPDFTPDDFDIQRFANDPELGENVPANLDSAKINRRPKYMPVYLVKTAGQAEKLILPVFGKGLWSTLYGFVALDRDLQTITGLSFYQHGETPGLGGEVDNPRWKQQWPGKQAFDREGRVIIKVLRGKADAKSADAGHQVDGLAGATLTSRGVDRLLNYWLGEYGYGPLLARLRQEWHLPRGHSDV
ncbi:MAG: Na(+)-translocating NADH-quinone reductase subunit C [Methylobacter sp.]|nr:Na(+)-translocating NADH-quinone reductase subunit C [Methylobacter sp.]